MKYEFYTYLLICFFVISCSSSGDDSNNPNNINLPEVSVISYVDGIFYQQDVDPDSESVTITNLTEAFGVDTNTFSSNYYESIVSIYNDFNPTILLKNVITNESYIKTGLCEDPDEAIIRITSNFDKILVFTSEDELTEGGYRTYLWILDRNSENCHRIYIGNLAFPYNIRENYYIEDNNILIGFYDDLLEKNKIINIDLNSNETIASLEFEQIPFSATIVEDNKLVVFYFQQDNKVYNKYTLEPIQDSRFDNIFIFNPSFFKSEIHNNKLYYDIELAQPYITSYTPGYIDLTSSEIYGLEVYDLLLAYAEIYDVGLSYRSYTTYPNRNLIVFGFTNDLGEHGILYTNYEGEILKVVPIEHEVRYILKK